MVFPYFLVLCHPSSKEIRLGYLVKIPSHITQIQIFGLGGLHILINIFVESIKSYSITGLYYYMICQ